MGNDALVPYNQPVPGEVAGLPAVGGIGFESFELKPVAMQLIQKPTGRIPDGVPGKFREDLTGSHFDKLRVIPLVFQTRRVMFPEGADLSAKPICRSDNGVVPSPFAEIPQAAQCALCDFGPKAWKDYRKTGKKPACQEKMRIVFIDRETQLPYFLVIGGSSLSAAKKMHQAIAWNYAAQKANGLNLSLFDFVFDMIPEMQSSKKGTYYVVKFTNLSRVANPGEFGGLYQQFVASRQKIDEAVEAEVVAEESNFDAPVEA